MRIELKKILPAKSYVGEDMITEEKEGKLLVYYVTRYPTGKPKTDKFQPAKALFPKRIEIQNELVECFGMYQGDGQKSIKSKSYQSTRFSNSEPRLLKLFLKFLNCFDVRNKDINCDLRISKNIKHTESQLIDYWSKLLDIPSKNFYKIQWRDNKYKDSKVAPYGTLTIIYSNSSFRVIFDSMLNYIKKQTLNNKRFAASFLRGLIAADGNVYYNQSGLREVSIAAKEEKDREYIRKLFCLMGIQPNKDNVTKNKEEVRVTGFPNFEIIKKYDLCSLHPTKKQKFEIIILSYKNKCYRKGTCVRFIGDLLKKEPQTVYLLADKLKRKPNAVRRYLKTLELKNRVKRELSDRTHITGRVAEKWRLIGSSREF